MNLSLIVMAGLLIFSHSNLRRIARGLEPPPETHGLAWGGAPRPAERVNAGGHLKAFTWVMPGRDPRKFHCNWNATATTCDHHSLLSLVAKKDPETRCPLLNRH